MEGEYSLVEWKLGYIEDIEVEESSRWRWTTSSCFFLLGVFFVADRAEETIDWRGLLRREQREWWRDDCELLGSSSVSAWRDSAEALSSTSVSAWRDSGESSVSSSLVHVADDGLKRCFSCGVVWCVGLKIGKRSVDRGMEWLDFIFSWVRLGSSLFFCFEHSCRLGWLSERDSLSLDRMSKLFSLVESLEILGAIDRELIPETLSMEP